MPITKQRRMQNKQKIYLSQKRKWKFSNNWRWFKRLSTSQAWCFTQTCPVCLEEDTHRLPRTFNACCSPPPRSLFSPQTESCWAVWLACRKITPAGIRGYWKDKQFTFWDECVGDSLFFFRLLLYDSISEWAYIPFIIWIHLKTNQLPFSASLCRGR